jgi:hypothetical protein
MWKSFSKTVYFKTDKSQSFVDNRRSSEELQILASYKTVFHLGGGGQGAGGEADVTTPTKTAFKFTFDQ